MTTPPKPVKLQPKSVFFGNNYGDDQKAIIRIVNDTDKIIAWRVSAAFPDMYGIADSEGFIDANQNKDVEVVLKRNFVWDRGQMPRHKLTFTSLQVTEDDKKKSIADIYATGQAPVEGHASVHLQPPAPRRPSFISNKEYVPSLIIFFGFVLLCYGVQCLAKRDETMGFIGALVVLSLMCEWERRARYSFGRVSPRAHFDPLNLIMLPNRRDVNMMEPPMDTGPPSPWISRDPQTEKIRSDPATVIKRAQDLVSESSQPVRKGVVEQSLCNLLESAIMNKSGGQVKQPSSAQASEDRKPPSNEKDKQPQSADDLRLSKIC